MFKKQNLRQFAKIVKIVILAGVLLAGFALVGQGDKEFQEMRSYQVTHQPKIHQY